MFPTYSLGTRECDASFDKSHLPPKASDVVGSHHMKWLELPLSFSSLAPISQSHVYFTTITRCAQLLGYGQLKSSHKILCSAMDRYLLVVQSVSNLVGEAKSCL